jgi:hypothetical protein
MVSVMVLSDAGLIERRSAGTRSAVARWRAGGHRATTGRPNLA